MISLETKNYQNSPQDEADSLKSPVTIKEVEFKSFQKRHLKTQMVLLENSTKNLSKKLYQFYTIFFRKERRREHFPAHFRKPKLP